MEDFLEVVEEPTTTDVNIYAKKLNFFNTKLKIWDYSKISLSEYQNISVDDRSSILRNYYHDWFR